MAGNDISRFEPAIARRTDLLRLPPPPAMSRVTLPLSGNFHKWVQDSRTATPAYALYGGIHNKRD